jgi:amidophosphoribosyltransferase
VDSLYYLSLEGLTACMRGEPGDYCSACWSGNYKIPIDQPQAKFNFERDQLKMF